jgi:hypothetical protein
MPHEVVENLVIEALRKLLQDSQVVAPDSLIAELSKSSKLSPDVVIQAIWRLAELDEIEFREGRRLVIGQKAREAA